MTSPNQNPTCQETPHLDMNFMAKRPCQEIINGIIDKIKECMGHTTSDQILADFRIFNCNRVNSGFYWFAVSLTRSKLSHGRASRTNQMHYVDHSLLILMCHQLVWLNYQQFDTN